MKAIQVQRFGGPEVLQLVDVPEPQPTNGELVIEVLAAGVNYADTHKVENSYMTGSTLPFIPGVEAVGRTADGRRVVGLLKEGGYAERALALPGAIFDVPDSVEDGEALALVLQGLTAWHLLQTSAHLAAGESVVIHAAAGGVGSLAVQLAKYFGAGRVIGVVSSPEKRTRVLDLGADAVLDASPAHLKTAIEQANGGRKVDVVLEMVGGETFSASLDALAPFGRLIYYGTAGRVPAPAISPAELMRRSRGVIGFYMSYLFRYPGRMKEPMLTMLDLVAHGGLRPIVGGSYPLSEARRAHEDLRARRTTGKLILLP